MNNAEAFQGLITLLSAQSETPQIMSTEWDHINWHRCAGHLLHNIQQHQLSVNEQLLTDIMQTSRQRQMLAMEHIRHIIRLSKSFEQHNIQHLWLKGPTLSQRLYNDPCRRSSRDLDVIIGPSDIASTHQLLIDAGFNLEQPDLAKLIDEQPETLTYFFKDIVYINDSGTVIELHWRWDTNPYMLNFSFEQAWQQRSAITIANHRLYCLDPEDEFIYLCMHGCKSSWARLNWLIDINHYLQQDEIDWRSVAEKSNQYQANTMLVAATRLCKQHFNREIPAELQTLKVKETAIKNICHYANQSMENIRYPSPVSMRDLVLQLQPSFKFRFNLLYRYCFSYDDAKQLKKPIKNIRLFYMLAPFLFAYRQLKQLTN